MMTDSEFNDWADRRKNIKHKAILAKNQIARMQKANNITEMRLVACLKDIETYIGEGNQPSVYDILNSEEDI